MATSLSPTDEEIVARVIQGRVDEYALLMQRYEQKLTRYVIYLIHDHESASDVVQETFIKAYQNIRSFNSAYAFSSWIYRIAHNEAMNLVKRNRYIIPIEDDAMDQSYASDIDELIDSSIVRGRVRECMDKLSSRYRDIVQLIYFEHMTYEQTGDILHLPTSTVGVRLSRAKAKLKAICQEKGVTR